MRGLDEDERVLMALIIHPPHPDRNATPREQAAAERLLGRNLIIVTWYADESIEARPTSMGLLIYHAMVDLTPGA